MKVNSTKQKLLLEYLASSPDIFALCKGITKPEYFNPEYRKAVEFMHDYYDKYHSIPSSDQIFAETDTQLAIQPITKDQISYCSDEIEQFCRRKALQHAIIAAPQLIEEGDDGKMEAMIKDAMSISLNRDLGIEYFDSAADRLERASNVPMRTPTKWPLFDDLIGGGLARTEMILFSANSGGGKSVTLANLAVNFMEQGLNVLYLSLELSEDMIAQRFDTMFTGIPSVVWQQKYLEITSTLSNVATKMGKLQIKRMQSGTTSNQIRAYLKEFELKYGYVPDLLIVDYLDIMGSNEKISAELKSEKDKLATEQLRDIGFDYDMFIATASQQNRGALEAVELNQGIIAGGLTKVNTVDWYVSVIMTPVMKASGEIGFCFLKTRNSNGEGKTIYLKWDNNALRIRNPSHSGDDRLDAVESGIKNMKIAGASSKQSLSDLFNVDD